MPDQVTPGITSDDAAIFSLNSPRDNQMQPEDPFKDGRDTVTQSATRRRRIKSGAFAPVTPLFRLTPGAKNIQW